MSSTLQIALFVIVSISLCLPCDVLLKIKDQPVEDKSPKFSPICQHKIYCLGVDPDNFFHQCAIHCDHKDCNYKRFANMRLLRTPDEIVERSKPILGNISQLSIEERTRILTNFRDENFVKGDDVVHWTPSDFRTDQRFISLIKNRNVRAFATTILTFWPGMGRKITEDAVENPDLHSVINLPNGFLSTSNDSQEWRYWDSYWILEGLLLSRMFVTARGMLDNIIHLVEKYDYVPSGNRVYYLDRSHPPVLARMVALYINRTSDLPWLRTNIDTVAKELNFWLKNRFTSVKINNTEYKLAQYLVRSHGFRSENLAGDLLMTEAVSEWRGIHLNEMKSASESGWEFSSRWIFNGDEAYGPLDGRIGHPRYSNLSRIIPVDLNAILHGGFERLAGLYEMIGQRSNARSWRRKAEDLREAIHVVHWNETDGTWYDYDTAKGVHRNFYYASNLAPLWTRAYPNGSNPEYRRRMGVKAVKYLKREGIPNYIGIPASTLLTNEEWDFPNAWAPSQSMIVQGLHDTGHPEAMDMAQKFAKDWLQTTYHGYKNCKCMLISYDVTDPGHSAYWLNVERPVYHRTGYGWTNGVVLSFIHAYEFPYGTLVAGGISILSDYSRIFYIMICLSVYLCVIKTYTLVL